jgi:hypothetical protein
MYPTAGLPFYRSDSGVIYHRVRSLTIHQLVSSEGPVYSHTSVQFWCGNSGFIDRGCDLRRRRRSAGRLYETIDSSTPLCATCEGRAIGAGQIDSGKINGRPVIYRPRVARQLSDQQSPSAAG